MFFEYDTQFLRSFLILDGLVFFDRLMLLNGSKGLIISHSL
jgi:hypothetical protein